MRLGTPDGARAIVRTRISVVRIDHSHTDGLFKPLIDVSNERSKHRYNKSISAGAPSNMRSVGRGVFQPLSLANGALNNISVSASVVLLDTTSMKQMK